VDLGLRTSGVSEADLAQRILFTLRTLADAAGGDPPLPSRPSLDSIRDLEGTTGNAQVVAMAEAKDALKGAADTWRERSARIPARRTEWDLAKGLVRHAATLELCAAVEAALGAVNAGRSLLDEPDPIEPVVSDLAQALRKALGERLDEFVATRDSALADLAGTVAWAGLREAKRAEILAVCGLADQRSLAIGTTAELLTTLDAWPLAEWQVRIDAIATQVARAYQLAVRETEASAVPVGLPRRVIHDRRELDAYLQELRQAIEAHLDSGDSVVM
jgi:hypothetical protein